MGKNCIYCNNRMEWTEEGVVEAHWGDIVRIVRDVTAYYCGNIVCCKYREFVFSVDEARRIQAVATEGLMEEVGI